MNKLSKRFYLYFLFKKILPPFITDFLKNTFLHSYINDLFNSYENRQNPSWHTINSGELVGIELFVDSRGIFKDMINGTYDSFFIEYLKNINMVGKTVFDIGAHIGYDSLLFSKAIGEKGKVISFEPNSVNKERLDLIISRNEKLLCKIETYPFAISNKKGTEVFIFSNHIDNGTSSGSFIENSSTFWEKHIYEKNIGFKRCTVDTIQLDSLNDVGIFDIPSIIKIDVEGAEHLVLEGGIDLISKNKPILLIEIHSIFNMFKVSEVLKLLNYEMSLLKLENDGRCFLSAKAN